MVSVPAFERCVRSRDERGGLWLYQVSIDPGPPIDSHASQNTAPVRSATAFWASRMALMLGNWRMVSLSLRAMSVTLTSTTGTPPETFLR
ncbi:MAG: hypothetical protein BWY89_02016 [Bacteroidetes bacterium ADurb.BinA012]|nr:MAG: hypothetical protein BWY89_02016 [Bacteroidetes bacterium ADurb.BinA012]